MRADILLVEKGLAPSRSAAARLIESGAVRWRTPTADWQQPRKAGELLPAACELEVTDAAELRWASRAGLKLEGVMQQLGITAAGLVGIDVGHGQLLTRLREDPRVSAYEGLNARELNRTHLGADCPSQGFDLIVGDLSFISQTLVWPALVPLLAEHGQVLMLVKPQFELQPRHIGKGGIVKPDAPVQAIEAQLRSVAHTLGLQVQAYVPSPITGGDGNVEHFILMRHAHA